MVDKSHAPFIVILLTLVVALLIFIAISRPSVNVQKSVENEKGQKMSQHSHWPILALKAMPFEHQITSHCSHPLMIDHIKSTDAQLTQFFDKLPLIFS
ncbi:hypothetical protein niasHT_023779 [Heterodera trifolii]|uniref:Uncharacterized protein n=1 Tax=Heterodera trifolii TaxID=157864 RepID=A0ABD2JNL9_9BILA